MVEEWIAIFAAYGVGVGLVHGFRHRCHWGCREPMHVVIVTRDCGLIVEWHLRTFVLLEWLQGRYTKVTVLDEGSTDDTVQIARKMVSKAQEEWEIVTLSSAAEVEDWLRGTERVDRFIDLRGHGGQSSVKAASLP